MHISTPLQHRLGNWSTPPKGGVPCAAQKRYPNRKDIAPQRPSILTPHLPRLRYGFAGEHIFADAIEELGGTTKRHRHIPPKRQHPSLFATGKYGNAIYITAPDFAVSFPDSPTYHVEVKRKKLISRKSKQFFPLDTADHFTLMRCLDSQRRTLLAIFSPQLSNDPLRSNGAYLDAEDLRPGNVRLLKRGKFFLIPIEMFRPLADLAVAHLQLDGPVAADTSASIPV